MKITINGKPKEIAALAPKLQGQPKECDINNTIKEQIALIAKASQSAASDDDYKGLAMLAEALSKICR